MIDAPTIGIDLAPFNAAIDQLKNVANRDKQAVEAFLMAFPIEQLCECVVAPCKTKLVVGPSEILNNFIGSFDLKGVPCPN